MEPADATTTPPPSERHRSPKMKRQRNAAAQPLGDVTNLLLPSTPTNPTTSRPRPLPSDTTAAASTCSPSPSHNPVSKPSPAAGETAAPNPISARFGSNQDLLTFALAAAEERSLVKSAISTVYTRRNTTQKRRTNDKAPFPAGTSSCPPPATLASKIRKTSVAQGTRPISSSAPCHRSKRKKSTMMENTSSGKHMLPEDFVKKQRAYFEEVDAFELLEEAASETDLE
uniref:Sororin C-terminal region domain-containing protein n=1 Tax=Oryza punctata TaxID=4537 RepID=A0A0E0MBN4_ORYPU